MRLFILTFLGLLFHFSCAEKTEKSKPIISTLIESVYASVTIQPEGLYDVYASASGILDEIYFEEGDVIKKDQILAKITESNLRLNIEDAMLNVELARENYRGKSALLSNLTEEINSNEMQLIVDSLNYFRQNELWKQSIGSKTELESKKLKYELTSNKLNVLRKKYNQTELELETSYKKSQNALKKAKTNLNDYFIKAKIDGTVYSKLKKEGELINQQEPLAQIGKSKSFLIEMLIDEVDIAKVKLGQRVLVNLDAYGGDVFEASITKIYPQKDIKTQTFKIEGLFNQPPKALYAGLSGEANIILSEKKRTMIIPLEYLMENNKVKTERGELDVIVGLKNMENVEIISGIDTATIIIKP